MGKLGYLLKIVGHRFFDENVDAAFRRRADLRVVIGRKTGGKNDDVQILPVEHLPVIQVVAFRADRIHAFVDFLRVRIGEGGDFHIRKSAEGQMGVVPAEIDFLRVVDNADFPGTVHETKLLVLQRFLAARYSSIAVLTGQTVSAGQREISSLSPS